MGRAWTPARLLAIEHEHARGGAVGESVLSDQFFGQVKVEIREIHRTFRLAKRQVTEPWRASLAIPMVGYAFAEPAELLETACLRARLIVRC